MKPLFLFCCLLSLSSTPALAIDVSQPNVQSFIERMVETHGFDRDQLQSTLADAERKENILEAISKPAERTLNWGEYRDIFITKERIEVGAAFWRENAEMLADTAERTGVPEEILVGIIGVETYYGRITGGYRVLDALSTLAFHYPRRSKFFSRELEQYLLLVREEGIAAEDPTGSYAGAMGRPQFMPSSFRAYAVDSTGDGKRDIWTNWADVAGSIANYFNAHGWQTSEPVAVQATLGSAWAGATPEPANTLKPADTIASLSDKGVVFSTDLSPDDKASLLTYEGHDGIEHWVGYRNFFVITRYNRSVMYALAVYQLGEEVAREVRKDAS